MVIPLIAKSYLNAYEPNNEVNGVTYARELASEERSVEPPCEITSGGPSVPSLLYVAHTNSSAAS